MPNDSEYPRARQAEADEKLLAASRETIQRSRQLLIETKPQTPPHRMHHPHNVVSLIEVCDEWHVIVDEEGKELVTRSFEQESHAWAYAEGQRLRLGVDEVIRL
jgi:hypothetical protein